MHAVQVYFQQKGLILSHSYVFTLLQVKLLSSMHDKYFLFLNVSVIFLCYTVVGCFMYPWMPLDPFQKFMF